MLRPSRVRCAVWSHHQCKENRKRVTEALPRYAKILLFVIFGTITEFFDWIWILCSSCEYSSLFRTVPYSGTRSSGCSIFKILDAPLPELRAVKTHQSPVLFLVIFVIFLLLSCRDNAYISFEFQNYFDRTSVHWIFVMPNTQRICCFRNISSEGASSTLTNVREVSPRHDLLLYTPRPADVFFT